LATVVYELPRQLTALGEKAFVVTPLYTGGHEKARESMRTAVERHGVRYTGRTVRFQVMDREYEVGVHYGEVDGVGYYMLHHHELFDGLYWGYTSEEKLRRRVGFCRACAELIRCFGLVPTAVFTNDAFAGPFHGIVQGDRIYAEEQVFRNASLLQIVHNAGWQYFDAYQRYENGRDLFALFNLPHDQAASFSDPTAGERLNCLAAGVRCCDQVVTVSPGYARQISVAADGLESLLQGVVGINNAIGADFVTRARKRFRASGFIEENTPALQQRIADDAELRRKLQKRYPELLNGGEALRRMRPCLRRDVLLRMRNKLLLQLQRGLAVDPDKILAAMIHRVCEQKGFHLVLQASEGLFKSLGFQAILGGAVASGDRAGEELAQGLLNLQVCYPHDVSAGIGFQDVTAPLFCADVFLMPSMYEPGGISQLEAFACGCLVVARATGGLRDTVVPIRVRGREVTGNGFLFADFSPASFYDAMRRCADFFRDTDETTVGRVRREANRTVYYWDRPARQYRDLVYGMKEIVYPV
jgi:starch synthase